jgi:hypothetical protein
MKHATNLERVRRSGNEEESVITDTKPKFFSARKGLHIAFA